MAYDKYIDKEKRKLYMKKYRVEWEKRNPNNKLQRQKRWRKKHPDHKRNKMNQLRLEKGGRCAECGFDKEIRILHFHHLRDKVFSLSYGNHSWKKMREEAEKCILLCPNCHAIIHLNTLAGVTKY